MLNSMDMYFIKSKISGLYVHYKLDAGYYVDTEKVGACLFMYDQAVNFINMFNDEYKLTLEPLIMEKLEQKIKN